MKSRRTCLRISRRRRINSPIQTTRSSNSATDRPTQMLYPKNKVSLTLSLTSSRDEKVSNIFPVELKSKPLQKCELCGSTTPAIKCQECNGKLFCPSCDDMFHRHPKRQNHARKVKILRGGELESTDNTDLLSTVSLHCRSKYASPVAAQGRTPTPHRSTASQ